MKFLTETKWEALRAGHRAHLEELEEQLEEATSEMERYKKELCASEQEAQDRMDKLTAALQDARKKGTQRRVVIASRPATAEGQLAQIFLFAPGTPLWDAVLEALDDAIVEAGNYMLAPDIELRTLDRQAAAQSALVRFKADLLGRVEEAQEAHRKEGA